MAAERGSWETMIRVPGENLLPPWGLWSWGQWSESHGDWHACPSHCSYYFPFNNSFGPVLISDINECFFTVNGHDLNAMVSSIKICIPSIAGIKHIAGTPSDQQLETILRIEIWLICSVLCIGLQPLSRICLHLWRHNTFLLSSLWDISKALPVQLTLQAKI